jgi:hypothetical protein
LPSELANYQTIKCKKERGLKKVKKTQSRNGKRTVHHAVYKRAQ